MPRTIGTVMPMRPDAAPTNQVPVYPMAAYTLGLRKAGQFHVMSFKERAQEPFNPLVPHSHDFYELIWVRSGLGEVHSDLHSWTVTAGSLFIAAPGQVHYWRFPERTDGEIVSFTPEFFMVSAEDPGLFGRLPFLHTEGLGPVLGFDASEAERMNQFFHELRTAAADPAPGRDDLVRSYLTIMLTHTRRVWTRVHQQVEIHASTGDLLACRFRLALDENFPQMLTVSEYANLLRVSRSHLNEELRRQSGSSASKIIHERILLEAKRLLVHSTLTISEIAYRLRFQDPSYFGRFFRKCTGQTPGMYREAAHHDLLAS